MAVRPGGAALLDGRSAFRGSGADDVLLEREHAMAALASVLGGMHASRGRALLIEGPAGIGKTALLDEAQRRAQATTVLRASGGEFERDLALGVVRQLFEPVLWRATDAQRARAGCADRAGSWGACSGSLRRTPLIATRPRMPPPCGRGSIG